MLLRKYTKEQLIDAVSTSTSIRQVLIKLKVAPKGGNYRVVNRYIKIIGLDTSHFLGQGWNKGNSPNIYIDRTLADYLNNKFPIQSNNLRLRLLKAGIFQHQCSKCLLLEWQDQPIPLELDHIDGDHSNNQLENLRLLCPNCHAQTSTYRGRNTKHHKELSSALPD